LKYATTLCAQSFLMEGFLTLDEPLALLSRRCGVLLVAHRVYQPPQSAGGPHKCYSKHWLYHIFFQLKLPPIYVSPSCANPIATSHRKCLQTVDRCLSTAFMHSPSSWKQVKAWPVARLTCKMTDPLSAKSRGKVVRRGFPFSQSFKADRSLYHQDLSVMA
jgi:hypothetical protein